MTITIKQCNTALLLIASLISVFSVQAMGSANDQTTMVPNDNGRDTMNNFIIFDEDDMQICEQIIEHVISITKQDRAETVIRIFINENLIRRNDWVASFTFKDETPRYYLYDRRNNSIITITSTQFKQYWQTMTANNQQPDIPLYAEE